MTLTKQQREEIRELAKEMLSEALVDLKRDLKTLKEGLDSTQRLALGNESSITKVTSTVDRVIVILSGDDKISKEPGLIERVRDLERNGRGALLERAKLIGIWIGALAVLGVVYKLASALLANALGVK
jgi:hypothetical protein